MKKISDSIISLVEKNAILSGEELENKFMKNDERKLIQYSSKNIGFAADDMSLVKGFGDVGGASTASLEIWMLDSEERPQEIKASILANLIREKTGDILGS